MRYKFNCNEMKVFSIPEECDAPGQIRILLTVDKNDRMSTLNILTNTPLCERLLIFSDNPVFFDRPYVTDVNFVELPFSSRAKYHAVLLLFIICYLL